MFRQVGFVLVHYTIEDVQMFLGMYSQRVYLGYIILFHEDKRSCLIYI